MLSPRSIAVLLLSAGAGACNEPIALESTTSEPATLSAAASMAPARLPASGMFEQTGITATDVTIAGPNTIILQNATGLLTGTLAGTFYDDLRVVVHPDGGFTSSFTITCDCTIQGRHGTIEMVAADAGRLTSPTVGEFAGRAIITSATDELAGLHGVLAIEGTVDVPSGLSTYAYSGTIRFTK